MAGDKLQRADKFGGKHFRELMMYCSVGAVQKSDFTYITVLQSLVVVSLVQFRHFCFSEACLGELTPGKDLSQFNEYLLMQDARRKPGASPADQTKPELQN